MRVFADKQPEKLWNGKRTRFPPELEDRIANKLSVLNAAIDRLVHHSIILEFTGESQRMAAAKSPNHEPSLPRPGNMSVQQAAELTGFDDPFHFSRVFKRFKGVSPSEVRNVGG